MFEVKQIPKLIHVATNQNTLVAFEFLIAHWPVTPMEECGLNEYLDFLCCVSDVDGMSASTLSELYDELDALVRELSEELIQELARRDELEYEKELKNQFIALLLSIQRRQRELIESKRRSTGSAKTTDGAYGGNQPGCVS